MDPLLNLVLYVVIVCVLAYVLWWIVDQSGLPDPPKMLLRVVVALIAFVLIVRLLLGLPAGGIKLGLLLERVLV